MTDTKDFKEQEITPLFEAAKRDIDKINHYACEKKKEIVIKLAKDLEGKIQKDTICIEIVRRLKDKVSKTLIRNCLSKDYKQGYRIENAKKPLKKEKDTKLAPVVVLNKQEGKELEQKQEKKENHEAVLIGADGMTYTQREVDIKPSTIFNNPFISKDKVFNQTTGKQERKEQHSEKPNELENLIADKMESKEWITSSEPSDDSNKDILVFEFSIRHRDIQSLLDSGKPDTDDEIWFNGKVDLKTGNVISANVGRQYQQQRPHHARH